MKAKGFLLTRRARLDLEEIGIYIAVDNLERALSFLDELLEVCRGIGAFPAKGRVPPELRHRGLTDIREVVHGDYRILYALREKQTVVLHIFNAARLFRVEDLRVEDLQNSHWAMSPQSAAGSIVPASTRRHGRGAFKWIDPCRRTAPRVLTPRLYRMASGRAIRGSNPRTVRDARRRV